MKALRTRLRQLLTAAVGVIPAIVDRVRERKLKSELAFCGEGVSIRQPTVIEVPQNVRIGDHVSIASFVHMWGNGGITIGDRTMIASHVAITSATHDPDSPEMSRTLLSERVDIGSDVWIGSHAVIFPGVAIGSHAVVAAGAVVREDVASNTVVAGAPARPIRSKEKIKGSQ
jgi:acetyltransferase-like isoleucine patch superfamily enzyme